MGRHGQDIDHGALDALASHDLGRVLHEEEGRAGVDGEHAVEQLRRGIEERAAVRDAGGIDEHIDPPEGAVRRRHHGTGVLDKRQIGAHVFGPASLPGDVVRDGAAALGVAPADDDAARAPLGE
jgi:hypothetical protein